MFKKIVLLLLIASCSHITETSNPSGSSHFSKGELILTSQLLLNIHDGVMPPLDCVQDREEAEILLRAIHPRMDEVEIYLDKNLQDTNLRGKLLSECSENCTCAYIGQLIKDNNISMSEVEKNDWAKILGLYKKERENQCLSFIQSSYCQSALQTDLDNEKEDFISTEE